MTRRAGCTKSTCGCGRTATPACWRCRSKPSSNTSASTPGPGSTRPDPRPPCRRRRGGRRALRAHSRRHPGAAARSGGVAPGSAGNARQDQSGHPNATPNFDLKHDAGGMVDVEFVTQYLVLCHSGSHPVLVRNLGNIALLRLAGEAGLIPTDLALQAGDAYRTLRRVQHQMRLQGVERPASRPTSCRPSGPPCANSGRRCWAEPSGAGGSAARLAPTRRKIRFFRPHRPSFLSCPPCPNSCAPNSISPPAAARC